MKVVEVAVKVGFGPVIREETIKDDKSSNRHADNHDGADGDDDQKLRIAH